MSHFEDDRRSTTSLGEEVGFAVPVDNLILQQLKRIAPPPRAKANQKTVVVGALHAAQVALTSLIKPNDLASKRLAQLDALTKSMVSMYMDEQACDLRQNIDRSLAQHPAWRVLNVAGQLDSSKFNALLFLLGVHLLVAINEGDQVMSERFCDLLRRDLTLRNMSAQELQDVSHSIKGDEKPSWAYRFAREWRAFVLLYESDPQAHLMPLQFNEIVHGQLNNHAVYALRGKREAVLTDRCTSESQLHMALSNQLRLPFTHLLDQKLVLWLVLFSGLTFDHLSAIPTDINEQSLHVDVKRGCLHRSLRTLALDQPDTTLLEAEPAGLTCKIPLPRNLHQYLLTLYRLGPVVETMGDLIPALTIIKSHDLVYPSLSSLRPSWARLKNAGGNYLRQQGMDSLLTAVLTGDFGHTMKSKLYYCNVNASEIHDAAALAYQLLGFDSPVALTDEPVSLGSPLVPTRSAIVKAAKYNSEAIILSRPSRRVRTVAGLIDFHNIYTLSVALRICFALALRNTSCVILPGGSIVVITEKAIGGREGGMPVIVPNCIQQQVSFYRAHCTALLNRLPSYSNNEFTNWLRESPITTLKSCNYRMKVQHVSSTDAIRSVIEAADLSVDVGRKYFENELRRLGMPTFDIDRVMRHEVVGQASMSSDNFDSIDAWSSRVGQVINRIVLDLFGQPLVGLRGGQV